MPAGLLALTTAAIFTGSAIYVSVAEQPARLGLDDNALLREWQPAYKRGAAMQASIAIVSCALGLLAWWRTDMAGYLVGAVAIILPWPWTLLVMMPTNRLLEAMDVHAPNPQAVDHQVGQDAPGSYRAWRPGDDRVPVDVPDRLGRPVGVHPVVGGWRNLPSSADSASISSVESRSSIRSAIDPP